MAGVRKRRKLVQGEAVLPALAHLRAARDLSLAFALLYALLSGLAGFAHRPMTFAGEPATEIVALQGGALGVICAGSGTDPSSPDQVTRALCDACLLTAVPGLLARPSPAPEPCGGTMSLPWPPADVFSGPRLVAAAFARGPPSNPLLL